VIAAEGLAPVGRMIAAYRRTDGAATDFKIAWVTGTLRDLVCHQRCLSRWIPRIGGCGPMWLAMRSGGRSPGTWRRPHPYSLWRTIVSFR
jgi:hypothetical protein